MFSEMSKCKVKDHPGDAFILGLMVLLGSFLVTSMFMIPCSYQKTEYIQEFTCVSTRCLRAL